MPHVPRLPRETQLDVSKLPRLPRKVQLHIAKCRACHTKSRGVHDMWEPSARPEPAQCHTCDACHVKRRWMSQSATPATCPVPRLPRKVKADVTKRDACHAKRRGVTVPWLTKRAARGNPVLFFLPEPVAFRRVYGTLRLTRLPRHDRGPIPGGNRSVASCLCTVLRRALYHYATRSPTRGNPVP